MNKKFLRNTFLARRARIPHEKLKKLSASICERALSELNLDQYNIIHIYLPIANKNEINTWPLIHGLWEMDKKVVVPIMQEEFKLRTALLTPETKVTENKWKVPEPKNPEFIDAGKIDLSFIPLLVFDRAGNRIGYGQGYYDRFIEELREDTLKIGLSYFEPIDLNFSVDPWDQVMDGCITPSVTYRFSKP
jgi:5-formyltetrahydrofolate cyclo-ligase